MEVSNVAATSNDFYKQIAAPQKNTKTAQELSQSKPETQVQAAAPQIQDKAPEQTDTNSKKLQLRGSFDRAVDKFTTGIQNSADLNDTVEVPRTIFKGYLSFMAGTALMTAGSFLKRTKTIEKALEDGAKEIITKTRTLPKVLNILGLIIATFGTFSFVRPYLIKDKKEAEIKPETKEIPTEKSIDSESKPTESNGLKA